MAAKEEDEDDDYLNFPLPTESPPQRKHRETLTQARLRKQREAETLGRPKSKAELAAEQARKREEGLARSTLEKGPGETESKGLKIMQKLGFQVGGRLGKKAVPPVEAATVTKTTTGSEDGAVVTDGIGNVQAETTTAGLGKSTSSPASLGLLEPIAIEMKADRGGIGADSEKKRKFRAEVAARAEGEKKARLDGEGFRERVAREREERRIEGLIRGARGVAEGLDEEDQLEEEDAGKREKGERRLREIPVFWRGAIKERLVKERDRRLIHDFQGSFGTVAQSSADPEMDADDRLALGTEIVDGELDEEDEELDEFEALEGNEKLERLVGYLREEWRYCFWCKYRYPDEEMDGCPGAEEDSHG